MAEATKPHAGVLPMALRRGGSVRIVPPRDGARPGARKTAPQKGKGSAQRRR